ncbi:serine/threonine-protein kinase 17A-like [Saccoglossus kowalevskii]|uniref:Serine/threonine-protein kinase 17A-like n=1 Tax=Saccoglossus kowalevskii TaxID=10224 RepID=A0ABM0H0F2_SACKO|nr:PREDICTED: serine/threonine-protein kinase 17A-like [Saccoglossus kowalevskii]
MPLSEKKMNSPTGLLLDGVERRKIKSGNFHELYTVGCELGRGKYSVVKKCTENFTGKEFAAKFLKLRKRGKDCRNEILHEIAILEISKNNPRLISLHEVYETRHELILVLELAAGGELHRHCVCEKEETSFTERDVVRLLKQILEAVQYLHERNVVHLDIKPSNILLTHSQPAFGDVKLVDFGLARLVNANEEIREILGTLDYVAPEILSYEPITLATDMWSIGVLTYVMLTGISPFAADDKQETFLNISQCKADFSSDLWKDISPLAVDFIKRLLVVQPTKRYKMKDCLEHPWIKSSNENNNAQELGTKSPCGVRRTLSTGSDKENGVSVIDGAEPKRFKMEEVHNEEESC